MRYYLSGLALAALCLPAAAQEAAPLPAPLPPQDTSPVLGTWVTEQKTEITIAPCDSGRCGFLSKIVLSDEYAQYQDQVDAIGVENLTDTNNQDPALRDRPLLGLRLLTLDKQVSPGQFEGNIYNPQDGNTYFGRVEMIDADTIRLTGCAFVVLCQSQNWTRAPEQTDPVTGEPVSPPPVLAAAPAPAAAPKP